MREALEKVLGAYVTGITEMKNFEVVKDKVFSQSQGIVKRMDIQREALLLPGRRTIVPRSLRKGKLRVFSFPGKRAIVGDLI